MSGQVSKLVREKTEFGDSLGPGGRKGELKIKPLELISGGITASQGLLDIGAGMERKAVAKDKQRQRELQAEQERIIGISEGANTQAAFNRFVGQRAASLAASGVTSTGGGLSSAREDFESEKNIIAAKASLRAATLERTGRIEGLEAAGSGLQGFLAAGGRALTLADKINERRVKNG